MKNRYPDLGYGECDVIIEHTWGNPAIRLYEKARCVKTAQAETLKDCFANLATRQYQNSTVLTHRGFHKSGRNQEYVVPVFYNDCGWVDIGYDYAVCLKERFKFDIDLKEERYKSTWKRK